MMYANKFVVAVLVGGKVLREHGDVVHVPFGSEYSIRLRNTNAIRAQVRISIDGEDISNGSRFVVGASDHVDIERFVQNQTKGAKFKFIERTESIEAHRSVNDQDGLIKVEVWWEKSSPAPMVYRSVFPSQGITFGDNNVIQCNASVNSVPGITVAGSESLQSFTTVHDFPVQDIPEVIVLKLSGSYGSTPVITPITVKTKLECPTCGTKNSSSSKFCSECGTNLLVY